jgi:uncharacterized iron-regulated protein
VGLARGFGALAAALGLCLLAAACASPLKDKAPVPPAPAMPVTEIPRGSFFVFGASGISVLSDEQAAGLAAGSRYVLVGEGHANACDHAAQVRLIRALAAHTPLSVGLEMVAADRQATLDHFSQGKVPLEQLEKVLDWKNTWGYPFELYRPVFEAALELKLPLAGLNIPKDVVRALSDKGLEGLTPRQSAWLPEQIPPPPPAQRQVLEEEFTRHQSFMKPSAGNATQALERFLMVQAAWDTKMADAAVDAFGRFERPVVILAGSGHVEQGWGIGYRLRGLDPTAGVLLVMPWRGLDPVDPAEAGLFYNCPDTQSSRLGMTLEARADGVLVLAVEPGSKAAAAGLAPGDLVLEAGGEPVDGLGSLHEAAMRGRAEGVMPLVVLRGGQKLALRLALSSPEPPPASETPVPKSAPKPAAKPTPKAPKP